MSHGKFATCINCMDGRVQEPVIQWAKNNLGIDYVDMVTEPGPDGSILRRDPADIASIQKRVRISTMNHGSETVILTGHHDCAGFPVSKEEHAAAVKECLEIIGSWNLGRRVKLIGLWIDGDWKVERLI